MTGPNLQPEDISNRQRTRSQGVLSPVYLQQQEYLATLESECRRGRTLAGRIGAQSATTYQIQRKLQTMEVAWQKCEVGHRELL